MTVKMARHYFYGMGDQHLDVVASKLLERYKVQIELKKPKVAFRETIRKKADVEYKYKNSPAVMDNTVTLR